MLVLNILVRIVITRQLQSKISRNTYNLYMLVLNILVRIVTTRQLQSKISRNTYNPIRYSCPNCSCQATTRRGLKTHIQSVHDCVFHILVVIVITTQLKREIWGSTYKLMVFLVSLSELCLPGNNNERFEGTYVMLVCASLLNVKILHELVLHELLLCFYLVFWYCKSCNDP